MSDLLPPIRDRAERIIQRAQPVIVALGTTGLTGGAMAAVALFAGHVRDHADGGRHG